MKKLDLHNVRHENVRQELIWFIEENWGIDQDVQVVTGHSSEMRDIVIEILNEYDLSYSVGGFLGINEAFITVEM